VFTIYSESGSDSTMVSNLFIDEYMKSANDAQIKVYLYLLRMMGAHRAASVSDMADQFNHTEKDVVRSLRYWERKGLLNLDFDKGDKLVSIRLCRPVRPGPASGFAADNVNVVRAETNRVLAFSKPAENLQKEYSTEHSFLRPAAGGSCPVQTSVPADVPSAPVSEADALENFQSSPDRARLLFVIEQYIGKPLSLNEIRIIYSISEGLHFSDDLIDYLLQYCIDRGKKDFRYIKKVAENWAAAGIMTPAQAETAAAQGCRADNKDKNETPGDSTPGAQAGTQQPAPSSRRERKKAGKSAGRTFSSNSFNQFEQNDYDFDALEEELLQG